MKKILTILFVLLISQVVFAQTEAYKFAEYDENGLGYDNLSRYQNFIIEISKTDGNKGLVVIYTGNKRERFGNILGYSKNAIKGLELWLGIPQNQVSLVILEGKTFLAQEYWIIPKGSKPPYTDSYKFDWSKLNEKYYFSHTCFQCEPDYSFWTDFQPSFEVFATLLKNYPNYRGLILVNNYEELNQIKETLSGKQKLPRNRYSIRLRKKKKGEADSISVDIYLIPSTNNKKTSAKP